MKIIHHQIGRDPLYKTWNSCADVMIIFFYTDGGSIVFQDKIFPIKNGTLCFIRSKKQHYTMPDKPSVYDKSKIFVSEEIVNGILELVCLDKEFCNLFNNNSVIYAQIPEEWRKDVEDIYKNAKSCLNNSFKATFIQLFFSLMTYLKSFSIECISSPTDAITRTVKYINQNYSLPITLDDICKKANMSKYYFCRKFKDTVGVTPMQYLLNTRLASTKVFLADSNKSISEISEQCGFSSVSYFCQIFKKYNDISPSAYRKASRR